VSLHFLQNQQLFLYMSRLLVSLMEAPDVLCEVRTDICIYEDYIVQILYSLQMFCETAPGSPVTAPAARPPSLGPFPPLLAAVPLVMIPIEDDWPSPVTSLCVAFKGLALRSDALSVKNNWTFNYMPSCKVCTIWRILPKEWSVGTAYENRFRTVEGMVTFHTFLWTRGISL
jgi:hypothetical protein